MTDKKEAEMAPDPDEDDLSDLDGTKQDNIRFLLGIR